MNTKLRILMSVAVMSIILVSCQNRSESRVINATAEQLQTLKDIESEYVGKESIVDSTALGLVDTLIANTLKQ